MVKKLRRNVDVRTGLQAGIGAALAGRFVDVMRRVVLRDVRAPREAYKPARDTGKLFAPPRSARVELGELVHDANAPTVRRAAQLFVLICSWLGPKGRTGHRKQGHRLNVPELARRVGLEDPREVERYLAVFRSAGLLVVWQPPASSGNAKGNISGHCFNLYELPEIPPELERHLAAFHHAWWPRRARAPLIARGAPTDAAAIARALRERSDSS